MAFYIEQKMPKGFGRAGKLITPHGTIETPAFVTVATKATAKALTPEQVRDVGAQVVLGNTYHLYLKPGESVVEKAGGIHAFMNWKGPIMTDSGGFQVFSLGEAFENSVSKIAKGEEIIIPRPRKDNNSRQKNLAKIDEDGVTFRSHLDGSEHRFTPERSIEIQHRLGADIIFAFDECTSPNAPYEYQKEAMSRTHKWAKRSLTFHKNSQHPESQELFGIVQGGRFEDLRKESARRIGTMDFDGFGIGGSFTKEDIDKTLGFISEILPEKKPRHLLGIGEPADLFGAVLNGADTFDCVAPTRMGRSGSLYTSTGRINILNSQYKEDFSPIEIACKCYTCRNYTKSYISHLFRSKEMLGATLASIHNLYFIINLVKQMRQAIFGGSFLEFQASFLKQYQN